MSIGKGMIKCFHDFVFVVVIVDVVVQYGMYMEMSVVFGDVKG